MTWDKREQLANTVTPPLPCSVRNGPQPWCQLPAGAASWDVQQRSMLVEPCFLAGGPGLEPTKRGCNETFETTWQPFHRGLISGG